MVRCEEGSGAGQETNILKEKIGVCSMGDHLEGLREWVAYIGPDWCFIFCHLWAFPPFFVSLFYFILPSLLIVLACPLQMDYWYNEALPEFVCYKGLRLIFPGFQIGFFWLFKVAGEYVFQHCILALPIKVIHVLERVFFNKKLISIETTFKSFSFWLLWLIFSCNMEVLKKKDKA